MKNHSQKSRRRGTPDNTAARLELQMARYIAKTRPGLVAQEFSARAEEMQRNYLAQAMVLRRIEQTVAEVASATEIPNICRFWYNCYARQVYRVWRRIPRSQQGTEYEILRFTWQARGLDPTVLEQVERAVLEMLAHSDIAK